LGAYLPIRQLPCAKKHQVKNIDSWFAGPRNGISKTGQAFIRDGNESDLMALAEDPSLEVPFYNFLKSRTGIFKLRYFMKPKLNNDVESGPAESVYEIPGRNAVFVTGILLTFGIITLFAPMWCMEFVKGGITRLGIVTAFVVAFTVFLGFGTEAKPTEVLGAAAGYVIIPSQHST